MVGFITVHGGIAWHGKKSYGKSKHLNEPSKQKKELFGNLTYTHSHAAKPNCSTGTSEWETIDQIK